MEHNTTTGRTGNYPAVVQRCEHGELAEMYKSGMTLAEIGARFGITRERVRQIVSALGVTASDGGQSVRSFKSTPDKVEKLRAKNEKTEARIRATWGMSLDDYRAHVSEYGPCTKASSPMHKFIVQRANANKRGIEWKFTFAEWWSVWHESGKWGDRGRGAYVMARYGDGDTPYSKDTVYICTQSENSKDSYIVSPAAVRFADNPAKAGAGRGWYYAPTRSKKNPYYAQFNKKHLGGFPTEELARAAYEAAVEQHKKQA